MKENLEVALVSSRAEVRSLRAEWDSVLAGCASSMLSMTFDWFQEWHACRYPNRETHVLLVRDRSRPIAIVPLGVSEERRYGITLRKVGFVAEEFSSEFMIASERIPECVEAVMDFMRRQKSWDILAARRIGKDSPATTSLSDVATSLGLWVARDTNAAAPYLEIRGDWSEYFKTRSQKFRQNLRRCLAKLQELGAVTHREYSRPEEVDEALNVIFDIAGKSWQGESGTGISNEDSDRPFFTSFSRLMAQQGMLSISVLLIGDRSVAFEYNVKYGSTFYAVKCGYDSNYAAVSPSIHLRALTNEKCYEAGFREIDFMGVNQFWLSRWTELSRSYVDIFVYRKSVKCAIPYLMDSYIVPMLRKSAWLRRVKSAMSKS